MRSTLLLFHRSSGLTSRRTILPCLYARTMATFGDGSGKKERSPREIYDFLGRHGRITADDHQCEIVNLLTTIDEQIKQYTPPKREDLNEDEEVKDSSSSSSFFGRFFGGSSDTEEKPEEKGAVVVNKKVAATRPKGVYLYGEPGCGKTFLLDLAYRCAPMGVKRRTHFNEFMLDVHNRIFKWRKAQKEKGITQIGDPLPALADQLMDEAHILFFDEFQVLDVADAMVLRRLFDLMWNQGMVVLCTSNRPPSDLYLNGIQRDLFIPFICHMEENNTVVNLNSGIDYRTQGTNLSDTYFAPLTEESIGRFEDAWNTVIAGATIEPTTIDVMAGRHLDVPMACDGIARFNFDDLCRKPLGAADYLAITENFHTVFLENVPRLTLNEVNPIRRFIILIDELYSHRIRTIISAEAAAPQLFIAETNTRSKFDEVFAFDRCVSRLTEMSSKEYLDQVRNQQAGLDKM